MIEVQAGFRQLESWHTYSALVAVCIIDSLLQNLFDPSVIRTPEGVLVELRGHNGAEPEKLRCVPGFAQLLAR